MERYAKDRLHRELDITQIIKTLRYLRSFVRLQLKIDKRTLLRMQSEGRVLQQRSIGEVQVESDGSSVDTDDQVAFLSRQMTSIRNDDWDFDATYEKLLKGIVGKREKGKGPLFIQNQTKGAGNKVHPVMSTQ
jgi:hypothetical protein